MTISLGSLAVGAAPPSIDVRLIYKGPNVPTAQARARAIYANATLLAASDVSEKFRELLKGNTRNFGINKGQGRESIVHRVVGGGSRADFVGQVIVGKGYMLVINSGRTPGKRMPPPSAILLWMREKGLRFDKVLKGLARRGAKNSQTKNADWFMIHMAFVIARNIGRKGWAPPFVGGLRFIERGVEQMRQPVLDRFVVAEQQVAKLYAAGG